MAVHCHHNTLFEYCYNYQERVDYINQYKPESERKVRIERFFILTKEQVAMLPIEFVEASKKCAEAREKYAETIEEYAEVWKKYAEAWKEYAEAREKYAEAIEKYIETEKKYKPQLEEAHRKICGCEEWNGEMMVFEKMTSSWD